MNASVVDSKQTDLLSRIVGQQLNASDLHPHVVFLVGLVTLLLGVAYADQQVDDVEKDRLLTTLDRFLPQESTERRLMHLVIRGVREHRIYDRPNEIQILAASLSEAERVLLIGFGYVMAIADGDIKECEKQYLKNAAVHLDVNLQYLAVLEACFCGQKPPASSALSELRSLLDPSRFHGLDTVLVEAAKDIRSVLPDQVKHSHNQPSLQLFYQELDKFRERRKQVAMAYYNLLKLIKECNNRKLVSESLVIETKRGLEKLLSQRFRVSIVGEFSQGKSTLLNAIMGEEIQPVRVIPCNGTVAVLKYGIEKRVICRYKDGREEEIPVDDYKNRVAITEEAALGCISDAFIQSDLEEIVFEHPELNFCRSGVELIDSPGLNEHPERTAITQKLLKDADAVIFITNASKPLTWGERELLREVQLELANGRANVPAPNLFLIVNFVDLLRQESDRKQVRQLVEQFAKGQDPVLCGDDRIHFISARGALDAIQAGTEDEYSAALQHFTRSLETFLVEERGIIELRKAITKHIALTQACMQGIHQAQEVLSGELTISEDARQQIIEQIGHATGIVVSLRLTAKRLHQEARQPTSSAWNNWLLELRQRLEKKSSNWSSTTGIFKPKEMAQGYANQFIQDLQADFSTWQSEQLQPILKRHQDMLNSEIQLKLQELQYDLKSLERTINIDLKDKFDGVVSVIEPEISILLNAVGAGFSVMSGFSGVATMVCQVGKLALLPTAGVGLAVAVIGTVLFSVWNLQRQTEEIKKKVFDAAWEKFQESQAESLQQIYSVISTELDDRVASAERVVQQAIFLYESLLAQQERYGQQPLVEQQAEQMCLSQAYLELQQLQSCTTSLMEGLTSQEL
jgi:uncharacterized tellurite resistance protein B-like protein